MVVEYHAVHAKFPPACVGLLASGGMQPPMRRGARLCSPCVMQLSPWRRASTLRGARLLARYLSACDDATSPPSSNAPRRFGAYHNFAEGLPPAPSSILPPLYSLYSTSGHEPLRMLLRFAVRDCIAERVLVHCGQEGAAAAVIYQDGKAHHGKCKSATASLLSLSSPSRIAALAPPLTIVSLFVLWHSTDLATPDIWSFLTWS